MTKPWERDWGGEPANTKKKPWERDDITSQLEGAAAMGEQAQTGLAETLGDVAWQGLTGPVEGALKAPGAFFGDMPMYLGNLGRRGYDRIMRLSAEDKGKPAPAPTALTQEELAGAMAANPIGSQSVRTMWKDLAGFNDPVDPKTMPGRYVRSGGEFVGGTVATGGAINPGSLGRAFAGGVGFQAGRDLAPNSEIIPLAGALAGSGASSLAVAGGRAMIPNISPRDMPAAAQLVKRGVPVYPGQLSSNPLINKIYDLSKSLSIFGDDSVKRQQEAFTRAAGRTAGINAPEISQGVLDGAKSRIVSRMDNAYSQADIVPDAQLAAGINAVRANTQKLTAAQAEYLTKALEEVDDLVSRGPVNGVDYWNVVKTGSRSALNNALQSKDGTVAAIARDLRRTLEDALDRNAPAGFRPELTAAKRQYSNLKTIEPMAIKSGEDAVTPTGLLNRVYNEQGNVRGDLGILAKAGKRLLQPTKSSGTVENSVALGMLGAGVTGIPTAILTGSVLPTALAAAAPLAIPAGTKALLEAQWLTKLMLKKAGQRSAALGRPRPPASLAPVANTTAQAVGALQRPPFGPQWSSGGLLTY